LKNPIEKRLRGRRGKSEKSHGRGGVVSTKIKKKTYIRCSLEEDQCEGRIREQRVSGGGLIRKGARENENSKRKEREKAVRSVIWSVQKELKTWVTFLCESGEEGNGTISSRWISQVKRNIGTIEKEKMFKKKGEGRHRRQAHNVRVSESDGIISWMGSRKEGGRFLRRTTYFEEEWNIKRDWGKRRGRGNCHRVTNHKAGRVMDVVSPQ